MRHWLPILVILLILSGSVIADCDIKVYPGQKTLPDGSVKIIAYVKANIFGEVYTPSDAILRFYSDSDALFAGCENLAPKADADGQYYYECDIKKDEFAGKCIKVNIELIGPSKYCKAETSTFVCDASSSLWKTFTDTFTGSLKKYMQGNYTACILAFVLLGMLLATMFYSGKSPLSILDITTPNLPSPKTLAASGQLLGQMVYGRMRKLVRTGLDNKVKIFEDHGKEVSGNLAKAGKKAIADKIKALSDKSKGDPYTRSLLKFLALKMAERGESLEKIEELFKPSRSMLGYTEKEHAKLAEIIRNMKAGAKKSGKMGDMLHADLMDEFVIGYTHLNKMAILTGESGKTTGGVGDFLYRIARVPVDGLKAAPYIGGQAWVKKVPLIGKDGLGRLPLIGGFVGTSIDSFFRSGRITMRYGQAALGGLIRTGFRVKGAKVKEMGEALERERTGEEKLGYIKRLAYSTVTAGAAETTKVGGMFPIHNKMAELYRTLYSEAHYDAMVYILKRIYSKFDINLDNISENHLEEMSRRPDIDVLKLAGITGNPKAAQLKEVEKKILRILAETYELTDPLAQYESLYKKIRLLREVAESHGAGLDPNMWSCLNEIKDIHEKNVEEHIKAVMLYQHLVDKHGIKNANYDTAALAREGKFYFNIGRDSLTYRQNGQEIHSNLWSLFNLRQMIYSAELYGTEHKEHLCGGIEDILKASWLYIVNRLRSLNISEHDTNSEKIKARIEEYATSLLTAEGREFIRKRDWEWRKILTSADALKETITGGKKGLFGRDIIVEFGDYGGGSKFRQLLKTHWAEADKYLEEKAPISYEKIRKVFPQFMKGGVDIGYYDKNGNPIFWPETSEFGPSLSWWKVDMKRDWLKPGPSHPIPLEKTIGYYVDGIFEKGYKIPYKASIYRELGIKESMPITKEVAEKLKPRFRQDALANELYNFLNGIMAMNAYKYTNETMRFYLKTAQATLAGALVDAIKNKRDGDSAYEAAKARAAEVENLDFSRPEDLDRFRKSLEANGGIVNKYLSKPVTYDMLVKPPHAWVLLHEGGFAPFVKGMPLSDFDRVIGGYVALKDSEGRWRRFDPQAMDIKFGSDLESQTLKREFAALQNQKDKMGVARYLDESGSERKTSWGELFPKMSDWAKGNYERQKQYNTALWRYAQLTDDWHGFWEKSDITIRPKHEVLGVRTGILPFATHQEMPSSFMEPMGKVREWLRGIGTWIERSSLYAGGPVYDASYALNPISEYYRERYTELARAIRGHSAEELGVSKQVYKDYTELAGTYTKYQVAWEFGVDRNPWKHSTSYGLQQALAASFHYGPAATWDQSWYKPFFSKSEYYAFEAATWPTRIARYFALPAITAFRSFQMSLFGYPNKWNYQESAMQPWPYRSPDALGAIRSLMNPFYSSLNWFGLGGEALRKDMGGAKYRRGLKQTPAEADWIYKGAYTVAREGDANPGISQYDARRTLHPSSPMADYLLHRTDFKGYFSQDAYLIGRGDRTYIKREVGAPSLLLKREEELKGYSPLANPIHAWWNPVLFLWHLPFSPISPRDVYMHYKEGKRRMDWERMSGWEKTKQVAGGGGGGMLGTAVAQATPWYRDESGKVHFDMLGRRKDIIYCPMCGSPMQRWSQCSKCKKRMGGAGVGQA